MIFLCGGYYLLDKGLRIRMSSLALRFMFKERRGEEMGEIMVKVMEVDREELEIVLVM